MNQSIKLNRHEFSDEYIQSHCKQIVLVFRRRGYIFYKIQLGKLRMSSGVLPYGLSCNEQQLTRVPTFYSITLVSL